MKPPSAFHRLTEAAAAGWAGLVLLDLGPNLGAINRSALIASHSVGLPLAPDLYSLQGLRNLGPTLRDWRRTWADLKPKAPQDLSLPDGSMEPAGYVVMGHGILDSRPVKACQRWMDRIPPVYRTSVRDEPLPPQLPKVADDPYCLSQLKHYRSLMPLAMEAHKPMFHLRPADGAIGAHAAAVADCGRDFRHLARRLADVTGVNVPGSPES